MRSAYRLVLVLILSVMLCPTVAAGQNFEPRERLPIKLGVDSEGDPRFMNQPAVGDLNGDGFDDVVFIAASGDDNFRVTHNEPRPSLVILLNNRRGSFRNGTRELVAGSPVVDWSARNLHLEDFNGDGRTDVFSCTQGLDIGGDPRAVGALNQLFLSRPNKKLRNVSRTHLPQVLDFCHGSSAADVDLDGDIDVWVNNLGGRFESSYLMLNDGQGRFEMVAGNGGDTRFPERQIGPNGQLPEELDINNYFGQTHPVPFWAQFIDAENDGDPDLYLGYLPGTNRTWLLLNDGTGRFSDAGVNAIPRRPFRGETFAQGSAVADLNGDGLDDLLMHDTPASSLAGAPGRCQGGITPTLVSLLISNGNGTFRDETKMRTGQTESCRNQQDSSGFLIGDMNGDGAVDFFQLGHERLVFFRNNGRGHFTKLPRDRTFIGPEDRFLYLSGGVPVDVNNDGVSDWVENRSAEDAFWVVRSIHPNPGTRQCAGRPSAPRILAARLAGGVLTLRWQRPLFGIPTRYRIEAGLTPGAEVDPDFRTSS